MVLGEVRCFLVGGWWTMMGNRIGGSMSSLGGGVLFDRVRPYAEGVNISGSRGGALRAFGGWGRVDDEVWWEWGRRKGWNEGWENGGGWFAIRFLRFPLNLRTVGFQ